MRQESRSGKASAERRVSWRFLTGTREAKSSAPNASVCETETAGLLKRYPASASGFHLTGKQTERGCDQPEDISTLMPALVRYAGFANMGKTRPFRPGMEGRIIWQLSSERTDLLQS